jgi:cytochrome o ubiquinol oxidase operon protein cyoD
LGFGFSLALTVIAFALTEQHLSSHHQFPPHSFLIPLFVILAIAQLFVQLTLFLHVGEEGKPRWNLAALAFALIVVVILVGGTLWIMHNLAHMQMQEPVNVFTEENISPDVYHH